MSANHSRDRSRWNHLSHEKDRLDEKIAKYKKDIEGLKGSKKEWIERRHFVLEACKKSKVSLKSSRAIGRRDEEWFVQKRLDELQQIREIGIREAEAECESKRKCISAERDSRLRELNRQLDRAKSRVAKLEEKMEKQQCKCSTADSSLVQARKNNKAKHPLLHLFVRDDEVKKAETVVKKEHLAYERAKSELEGAKKRRNNAKASIDKAKSNYEERLSSCRPVFLRPDKDELLEEEKLRMLLDKMEHDKAVTDDAT